MVCKYACLATLKNIFTDVKIKTRSFKKKEALSNYKIKIGLASTCTEMDVEIFE